MPSTCPRGHDKAVVGIASNHRCRECRREDHREYKRRDSSKARDRAIWASSPHRRAQHGWTDMRSRLRRRIQTKRAAIQRLEHELSEVTA